MYPLAAQFQLRPSFVQRWQRVPQTRRQYDYQSIIMIGDGVTDMEVKAQAELVVGFGANRARAIVQAAADL
jgi:hypothetical protein